LSRYGYSIFIDERADVVILHGREGIRVDSNTAETCVFNSATFKVLGAVWHGGTLYNIRDYIWLV
jgi:hypothetical protein